MNWAKQQDTESIFRNQRHFCTPTMKYQKQQSGNKSHLLILSFMSLALGDVCEDVAAWNV